MSGGNWVVAAARLGGPLADLFGTLSDSATSRTFGRINDELTRQQIAIASEADAAARVRATGNLISSQRAALGASGVAGGRTQRLLEARVRINASREQRQANQSRAFAEASSRLGRIQNRIQARGQAFKAVGKFATDLLSMGASPAGNPGVAGNG